MHYFPKCLKKTTLPIVLENTIATTFELFISTVEALGPFFFSAEDPGDPTLIFSAWNTNQSSLFMPERHQSNQQRQWALAHQKQAGVFIHHTDQAGEDRDAVKERLTPSWIRSFPRLGRQWLK